MSREEQILSRYRAGDLLKLISYEFNISMAGICALAKRRGEKMRFSDAARIDMSRARKLAVRQLSPAAQRNPCVTTEAVP